MGQPQSFCPCPSCQLRRLIKSHMLVFFRLCLFILFSVHALTDKKIRAFRMPYNAFRRPGIRTVGYFKPLPGRTQYHFRLKDCSICFNGFSLLQAVPVFFFDSEGNCLLHLKPADPFNGNAVAVAWHIVVYLKSFYIKAVKMYHMLRLI